MPRFSRAVLPVVLMSLIALAGGCPTGMPAPEADVPSVVAAVDPLAEAKRTCFPWTGNDDTTEAMQSFLETELELGESKLTEQQVTGDLCGDMCLGSPDCFTDCRNCWLAVIDIVFE